MGKHSPTPPPAPDPYATAAAQTQSNQETALYNAGLNRPDQYTPYGSQTYTYVGKNADGSPHYRSDINFTNMGQQLFNQQQQQDQQVNNIANSYMNRIQNTMGQGLDTSGLPQLQGNIPGANDLSADRQKVVNDIYSRMNPELDRQQSMLDNKLANQGIMPGSEAYKQEQQQFGQQRNDALTQADMAGGQEQSRLFGLGLSGAQFANSARGQGLQEALTQRQLPLNEFNALRSASQIQAPQFSGMQPVNMQGTDISGNIYKNYAAQQDAYNQKVAGNNAITAALIGAGGSMGTAFMMSDKRLKRDIKKIGKTPAGINVYEFRYLDDDKVHTGVMAQEVEKMIPEAVLENADGYKMVNYAMVR